jgi:hypothetical protein
MQTLGVLHESFRYIKFLVSTFHLSVNPNMKALESSSRFNSLRLWIDKFPRFYLAFLRFRRRGHWSRDRIVRRDTQVVIEGFPRSANSFALSAFQSNNLNICYATHVHSNAQVVQACQWRIPTLLLLRESEDAVCADVSFYCELRQVDQHSIPPRLISQSLARYVSVQEGVQPVYPRFYVGHFPGVIHDFGSVMRGLSQYFGVSYNMFDHATESASEIVSKSHHIAPNPERSGIKSVVRDK